MAQNGKANAKQTHTIKKVKLWRQRSIAALKADLYSSQLHFRKNSP